MIDGSALWFGVFVGVSVAAGWFLHGILMTRGNGRLEHARPPAAACGRCGAVGSKADIVEHLRDVHNAPGDDEAVRDLIETVPGGRR